jgi:hypothetical protein
MVKKESQKEQDLEIQVREIYTPLSVAKKEIEKRWKNKELRKKVEDFLGNNLPKHLKDKPRAYLGRQIISPNKEFFRFLDLAKTIGLPTSFIECTEDIYTSKNPVKYHLCKMYFFGGLGRNGGDKLRAINIVDFDHVEGKRLCDIKTKWKQGIVDFHHEALSHYFPDTKSLDVSKWINKVNKDISSFYFEYLAIFTIFGVLFENYLTIGDEKELTCNVLIPTIKKIEKKFNIKPLIVPLVPIDDENSIYWYYYSEGLEKSTRIKI